MNKTILILSSAFALSLSSACLADDTKNKPTNDLAKDASNAMHALGKEADSAGLAIKSSANKFGKDNHKPGKTAEQRNDFQKNASNAMNAFGKEANKDGRAIASAVKGMDKNDNNAIKKDQPARRSENLWDQSLNEFGKGIGDALSAMEDWMKTLGKQGRRRDCKT